MNLPVIQEKAHNKYSPSATSRWLACPGSIKASEGCENKSSKYAEEGTIAHDHCERALRTGELPKEDPELIQCVEIYLAEVQSIRDTQNVIAEQIESKLECQDIPNFGGTADYFAMYPSPIDNKLTLHLVDYKHGIGVPVSAVENKQLLSYCVIIDSHFYGMFDRFVMTIVQPRAQSHDEVQTWGCDRERVEEHKRQILESMTRDDLNAGGHCRWCPAATTCPKLMESLSEAAELEFAEFIDVEANEVHASVSHWLRLLELKPAVNAVLDRVEEELLNVARKGVELPGYKVVRSMSHRRWDRDEAEVLKALAKHKIGKKIATETKLLSPPQLEKKGVSREIVNSIATQIELGHRIVPESTKGKAVKFDGSEFLSVI